jgi:hypothetical protein
MIRNRRPSAYRELMPEGSDLADILRSAVTTETLFSGDFETFRRERADMLAKIAQALVE